MGRAKGVYCTIHSAEGDFDTGPPFRTDYDGSLMTMYLPVKRCPFSGWSDSLTLHWGALSIGLGISPPVTFGRDDRLTVLQPISLDLLSAAVSAVKP